MPDQPTVSGAPTKRFFVSMLPRDIQLEDAILDLVDNSVDGAMRQERENLDGARPFEGYRCELRISEREFELIDNCGGIPNDHLDAAFRLGRPRMDLDANLPTIGMYGIGMKRAIFKMAKDASVVSRSAERAVEVRYDAEWLNPESDTWELPVREIDDDGSVGVKISVTDLHDDVATRFGRETFVDGLRDKLGQHFAYLIGRGFVVTLNATPVRPETVKVIFAEDIKPFDYEGDVDGVRVKVTIGFYRNLTRQSELEEATEPQEGEADARASEEAGITVICNDRVVVISDRTTITGWGLANVPKYHPQFRAITGIMLFSCEDASKLPISTTKRDLDTDSDVYRPARNASMDGMKLFVGFTNRWKGNEESVDALLVPDDRIEARTVTLARDEGRAVRGTRYGERQYVPTLPLPARGTRKRRIAFSREVEEVKLLGEALLGNRDARAGDIGVAAWEETLERRGPDE